MSDLRKEIIGKGLLMLVIYTLTLLGINYLLKGSIVTVIVFSVYGCYQCWRWTVKKLKEIGESESE